VQNLGTWLRQTREDRDESLGSAAQATRIRTRFLEDLEAGEFAALPGGEVQVRGFLRIYARHLALSPDEVLSRYESEQRANPQARGHVAQWSPPGKDSPRRRDPGLLFVAIVIGLVAMLAIATGVAYLVSANAGDDTASDVAAAATAEDVAATQQVDPSSPATPTFPVDPQGGVTVALEATEHVWVCVTIDGVTAFEGLLATGQASAWRGEEAVIVDTGNGAALNVAVNGQLQGLMGGRGQISTRGWSPVGEIAAPSLAAAAES
jgi:cytoskeletal protein RodZ